MTEDHRVDKLADAIDKLTNTINDMTNVMRNLSTVPVPIWMPKHSKEYQDYLKLSDEARSGLEKDLIKFNHLHKILKNFDVIHYVYDESYYTEEYTNCLVLAIEQTYGIRRVYDECINDLDKCRISFMK